MVSAGPGGQSGWAVLTLSAQMLKWLWKRCCKIAVISTFTCVTLCSQEQRKSSELKAMNEMRKVSKFLEIWGQRLSRVNLLTAAGTGNTGCKCATHPNQRQICFVATTLLVGRRGLDYYLCHLKHKPRLKGTVISGMILLQIHSLFFSKM